MQRILSWSLLAGLSLWLSGQCLAGGTVDIESVRLWAAPDNTRVVFDVSGAHAHKLFSLQNPERVVIDVPNGRVAESLSTRAASGGLVKGVRVGMHAPDTLRIVLDMQESTRPRSFSLKPNGRYGHRLVVDLFETASGEVQAPPPQPSSRKVVAGRKFDEKSEKWVPNVKEIGVEALEENSYVVGYPRQ